MLSYFWFEFQMQTFDSTNYKAYRTVMRKETLLQGLYILWSTCLAEEESGPSVVEFSSQPRQIYHFIDRRIQITSSLKPRTVISRTAYAYVRNFASQIQISSLPRIVRIYLYILNYNFSFLFFCWRWNWIFIYKKIITENFHIKFIIFQISTPNIKNFTFTIISNSFLSSECMFVILCAYYWADAHLFQLKHNCWQFPRFFNQIKTHFDSCLDIFDSFSKLLKNTTLFINTHLFI